MLGAVTGDIIGSRFQWNPIKDKNFALFSPKCHITDDTIITFAVAQATIDAKGDIDALKRISVKRMQEFGRRYPNAEYGERFFQWIHESNPKPYRSMGNGAAMRVSPCAWIAHTLEDAKLCARTVTSVTHNHPDSYRAAEAVVSAIYLAKSGEDIMNIRKYVQKHYYRSFIPLDKLRNNYKFDVTCNGSVPVALEAFFESADFEDTIRNAVSVGGDSDTIAAIAGSIAEAYYGIPGYIKSRTMQYLDSFLVQTYG